MIFAKGFSIQVTEQRCLNLKHHGVECRHCMEHCPTGAILYENNHLYLVKDKCNGCGLCFSDCPTEVFRSQQWDETTVIREITDEGWQVTEFFCGWHPAPYQREKGRERGAVQLPACLSSISQGAWYEVGLKGHIELHLEPCTGCLMKTTLVRLTYRIQNASEWLEASGFKPEINYMYESGGNKIKKRLRAIETGLKVTSRRDFFLSVIDKGRQISRNRPLGENGNGLTGAPSGEDGARVREVCLPEWQKRLAQVYGQNRQDRADKFPAAYWPTIQINDKCVQCGLCSNYCPTGALQAVVGYGQSSHRFTSGFCLDCRICELFCPMEAISRDREKLEQPFAARTIQTLPVIHCRQCTSITVENPSDLCYWCRGEVRSDSELVDAMKKCLLMGTSG